MARLGETARVRLRINEVTVVDTHGITRGSPLEDQVMLIWYTAHNRIATDGMGTHVDGGVEGPLNMHSLVRSVFGVGDDEARVLSGRIRQVLKKVGAARNVHPGGQGASPVWWIADSLPDNIVAVAQWVASNPNAGLPPEQLKSTRAEKRLTAREAGEDRAPAPVSVTVSPAVEEESSTMTAAHLEAVTEVEVEGPVSLQEHINSQKLEYERWLEQVVQIAAERGPITSMEVQQLLAGPLYGVVRTPGVIGRACRDLVAEGRLVSRFETNDEQRIRQLVMNPDKMGGRPAMLYGVTSEQLQTLRDTAPVAPLRASSTPTEPEDASEYVPTLSERARTLAGALEQFADALDSDARRDEMQAWIDELEAENARLQSRIDRIMRAASAQD